MKPLALLFAIGAFAGLALGACGGKGSPAAGGLVLQATSTEVIEGDTLPVTVLAAEKAGPVAWSSSDTRIACVASDGTVIGCSAGPVTITARTEEGAEGSIGLRVVADPDFNTQLPTDPTPFRPTLSRACTVDACQVTLHVSGLAATIRREGYRPYHRLQLPQAGFLADRGKPELPFYTLYFAIPLNTQTHERASWTVAVERTDPVVYEGIRPWPHQPPRWIVGDDKAPDEYPPFEVDAHFQATQDTWPTATYVARAVEVGNLPLLEVQVIPATYLPSTRRLSLYRSTRVSVAFTTNGSLTMPRPVGDYKAIKEVSADVHVADLVQNASLLAPVEAHDLLGTLPPIDATNIMDLPFDLLILTRPSLEPSARRLARWRQDHGTRVWLAVCDPASYPDAAALLALIQDLHELNRLDETGGFRPHAMRAILLFGDVEHIPTWEGLRVRAGPVPDAAHPDPVGVVGTDHPYSTLRGIDWISDVALGRISVDDDTQGDDVVAKIEAYEGEPAEARPHHMSMWGYFDDVPQQRTVVTSSVTFTRGSTSVSGRFPVWFHGQVRSGDLVRPYEGLAAGKGAWDVRVAAVLSYRTLTLHQPWPNDTVTARMQVAFQDGQDDWEFVKSAERIRGFMTTRGVPVTFGYARNDEPAPAPIPSYGFEGPLDEDLVGYTWDPRAIDIKYPWRAGVDGIVLHSDHGHPVRWNHPRFTVDDIDQRSFPSDPWYPIVLSINCSSGYFDSETDRVWIWNGSAAQLIVNDAAANRFPQHDVSFCEAALRERNGGGVAVIGASRGTDAGKNDKLIDGLFGALYVDYVDGVSPTGPGPRHAYEYLGDVVRAAKYVLRTWMLAPVPEGGEYTTAQALYPMQAYHLFGDPMLRVRTPEPPDEAR